MNSLHAEYEIYFNQKSKFFGIQEKQPISNSEFSKILNSCRTRTEVVEKLGYDKTWEWHDDTAVHAAIRVNSSKTLMVLLKHGADPTLQTGHIDDIYPNAFDLAEKSWSNCKRVLAVVRDFWKDADYKSARAAQFCTKSDQMLKI